MGREREKDLGLRTYCISELKKATSEDALTYIEMRYIRVNVGQIFVTIGDVDRSVK